MGIPGNLGFEEFWPKNWNQSELFVEWYEKKL